MNRNHGSDGGQAAAASRGRTTGGRAGAEVIYVGRSSFWVERDIDLFQEMPESPWPTLEVGSAAHFQRDDERVVAPAEAGAGIGVAAILGINLSGPIILQAATEDMARREDSHGTPLPAGEVAFLQLPPRSRWSLPSPLLSLMIVTVVAFSMGLVVSPLGDATALYHGGARTTLPHGTGTAAVPTGIAVVRPGDNAFRPLVVPSFVPSFLAGRSPAESPATARRMPPPAGKGEHPGLKVAFKKRVAKQKSAPPSRVPADPAGDPVTDGKLQPSRKSMDKESIDATKTSAAADSENQPPTKPWEPAAKPWEPAAKPWIDPWAN